MCEYWVGVGVDLINELFRESGEGEGGERLVWGGVFKTFQRIGHKKLFFKYWIKVFHLMKTYFSFISQSSLLMNTIKLNLEPTTQIFIEP